MATVFGFNLVIFAFIVLSVNGQKYGGIVGGLGELNVANDEVKQLVARLTPVIITTICAYRKESCPPPDVKITVNNYKTQVVGSGTNNFISVTVGDEVFHLKIFTIQWTTTEQVHRVQGPKQLTDEISYF